MAEVKWSAPAVRDLEAIRRFVRHSSPAYATTLIRRLYQAVDSLRNFPLLGREVPEVGIPDIRELISEGYRIVYSINSQTVEVLTILHSRQDLVKKLRRE